MGLDHVLGWEVHHLQTPAGPNDFPDSIKYLNYIDHTMCQQPPLRSQGLLSQPLDMWCLEMPCHRMLPWQACWPQPPRSCRQLLSAPTLHLCLDAQGWQVVRSGAESLFRAQWGNVPAWHPQHPSGPIRMPSNNSPVAVQRGI